MRLTIVGATGRSIGRHLLEQAVAAGHDVTVVVRNPSRLATGGVRVVTADLAGADPTALEGAVDRADAAPSRAWIGARCPMPASHRWEPGRSSGPCRRPRPDASSWSARHRSGRCRRRRGRSRRGTIPATDSSCVTCLCRMPDEGGAPQALCRSGADGGHARRERAGLDRRQAASAHRQAPAPATTGRPSGQNLRRGVTRSPGPTSRTTCCSPSSGRRRSRKPSASPTDHPGGVQWDRGR